MFSFIGFDTWAFAMIVILGVLSTRFGLGRKSSFSFREKVAWVNAFQVTCKNPPGNSACGYPV
jgi:hypothetical protein